MSVTAPQLEDRPYANRSTGLLLRDVAENAKDLITGELNALAIEAREEVAKTKQAVRLGVTGGTVVLLGAILCVIALAELVALAVPRWAAFGIVGAVVTAAGVASLLMGMNKAKQVSLVPDETIHEVKKDARWIKNETKSAVKSNTLENS